MNQSMNMDPAGAVNPADDDRTYAVLMHLSVLAHLVIPYIAVAIPIVMWMSRRDRSAFVDDHGREAVNFQLTLILYLFVLPVLGVILTVLTLGLGIIVLIPLIFLPYVLSIVGMILAVKHTNRGELFRYPMTIRFLQAPVRVA